MSLLGLIPEPPFDRLSWSGSSANFFDALRNHGVLGNAREVALGPFRELVEKGRAFSLPMSRWKQRYHSSIPRFAALTRSAGRIMAGEREVGAVLQIGAWFSAGACTRVPCFSYHDGNAALSYRYYGRGLVSGPRRREHLQWEKSVYSALTGIFVMSDWLADSFSRDFGVPVSKLHVVGAGINMDIPPVVPERAWTVPKYLLVGKDFERKGGKYLLEAFQAVRKVLPEAELIIVGPELRLTQPGVQCLGYLSKSDSAELARLKRLYATATAVVLPSVYEPFGISLLEGMAYGLPCIAADRCAMPEIVRNGETGLVVRAEDSRALADAMIQIGRSASDAARMGLAGRRRAESAFTWATVTGKIKAVLSDKYHI